MDSQKLFSAQSEQIFPVGHPLSELPGSSPNLSCGQQTTLPSLSHYSATRYPENSRILSQEALDKMLAEHMQLKEHHAISYDEVLPTPVETTPSYREYYGSVSDNWTVRRKPLPIVVVGEQSIRNSDLKAETEYLILDIEEEDRRIAMQMQNEEDSQELRQQEATDFALALGIQEDLDREEVRPVTRVCVVCGDDTPISDLPSLVSCTHIPQTCADCYASWIGSELEAKGWRHLRCPESGCKEQLQHTEVQLYASPEVFLKYEGCATIGV
jgi:hypothetical protein